MDGKQSNFNEIIGHIEDIVVNDDFKMLQNSFMDKYYHLFDESEENKLIYTEIFNEYTTLIEEFIIRNLKDRKPDIQFNELKSIKRSEGDGEIIELLYSLSDFLTFKELILDYKLFKNGKYEDLQAGIIVTRLIE